MDANRWDWDAELEACSVQANRMSEIVERVAEKIGSLTPMDDDTLVNALGEPIVRDIAEAAVTVVRELIMTSETRKRVARALLDVFDRRLDFTPEECPDKFAEAAINEVLK